MEGGASRVSRIALPDKGTSTRDQEDMVSLFLPFSFSKDNPDESPWASLQLLARILNGDSEESEETLVLYRHCLPHWKEIGRERHHAF